MVQAAAWTRQVRFASPALAIRGCGTTTRVNRRQRPAETGRRRPRKHQAQSAGLARSVQAVMGCDDDL
jgi:hypothetical protein